MTPFIKKMKETHTIQKIGQAAGIILRSPFTAFWNTFSTSISHVTTSPFPDIGALIKENKRSDGAIRLGHENDENVNVNCEEESGVLTSRMPHGNDNEYANCGELNFQSTSTDVQSTFETPVEAINSVSNEDTRNTNNIGSIPSTICTSSSSCIETISSSAFICSVNPTAVSSYAFPREPEATNGIANEDTRNTNDINSIYTTVGASSSCCIESSLTVETPVEAMHTVANKDTRNTNDIGPISSAICTSSSSCIETTSSYAFPREAEAKNGSANEDTRNTNDIDSTSFTIGASSSHCMETSPIYASNCDVNPAGSGSYAFHKDAEVRNSFANEDTRNTNDIDSISTTIGASSLGCMETSLTVKTINSDVSEDTMNANDIDTISSTISTSSLSCIETSSSYAFNCSVNPTADSISAFPMETEATNGIANKDARNTNTIDSISFKIGTSPSQCMEISLTVQTPVEARNDVANEESKNANKMDPISYSTGASSSLCMETNSSCSYGLDNEAITTSLVECMQKISNKYGPSVSAFPAKLEDAEERYLVPWSLNEKDYEFKWNDFFSNTNEICNKLLHLKYNIDVTTEHEPQSLAVIAVHTVSSALGYGPGREERIQQTGLPWPLQELLFQKPEEDHPEDANSYPASIVDQYPTA